MVQLRPVQATFIAGQLSAKFRGKISSNFYYNAFEDSLNYVVTPQGVLTRRPSTRYVSGYGNTSNTRIISFAYSTTESYLIHIVSDTIKIYNNLDVLKDTITPTGITGSLVDEVDFVQIRDGMLIQHRSFGQLKLLRVDDTNWTLTAFNNIDGPYDFINLNEDQKLKPSATTGTITISAKTRAGADIAGFFTSNDVGRQVRIRHFDTDGQTIWGVAKITSLVDSSNVNATVLVGYEFATSNGTKNWRLGSWSPGLGFAEKIAVKDNRIVTAKDDQIFGTVGNKLDTYSPTEPAELGTGPVGGDNVGHVVTDNSGLNIRMLNLKNTKILWLHDDQVLHIGTNQGHFILRGSSAYSAITPLNAAISDQSKLGCGNVKPVSLDNLFYVDGSRTRLFRCDYDFRTDRYLSVNLNVFADMIFSGKVKKMAAVTYPWSMIWCVLDDGSLVCLTYDKDKEVTAFTKHRITSGNVRDICVLKDTNGNDQIYFVVDDGTNKLIEKFTQFTIQNDDATKADYYLLDGAYVDMTPGNVGTVTGLERFNGETVTVIRDCNILGTYPVVGGEITFPTPIAPLFHVGIPFFCTLKSLPLEYADSQFSSIGLQKQAAKVFLGLYNTLNVTSKQVDTEPDPEEANFRSIDDAMGVAPALFTGTKELTPYKDWGKDIQFEFGQTEPMPITITYLNYTLEVSR